MIDLMLKLTVHISLVPSSNVVSNFLILLVIVLYNIRISQYITFKIILFIRKIILALIDCWMTVFVVKSVATSKLTDRRNIGYNVEKYGKYNR